MEIDFGVAYLKGPSENRVKVTMNEFKGQIYIHIREYGLDGDTGNLFPTPKGYAILAEELDSVIELLQKASKELARPFKTPGQLKLQLTDQNKEE